MLRAVSSVLLFGLMRSCLIAATTPMHKSSSECSTRGPAFLQLNHSKIALQEDTHLKVTKSDVGETSENQQPTCHGDSPRICNGHYGANAKQTYKIRYRPGTPRRPLIVFVWVAGWFTRFPEYVTADINIRSFSAPDVRSFVNFICTEENAGNYGIDCGQIALVGYSHAGIASTLAAQMLRKANGIQAVVNLAGQVHEPRNSDKDDCPSYLLFVGQNDTGFMRRTRRMTAHFDTHGVDYELHVLPNVGHVNLRRRANFINQEAADFLARHLVRDCQAGLQQCDPDEASSAFLCPEEKQTLQPGQFDEDTFRCLAGWCIPLAGLCNGRSNCGDDSDETNCCDGAVEQCLPTRSCHGWSESSLCDPAEATSAFSCPEEKRTLLPGQYDEDTFRCLGGRCIPLAGLCNGRPQCADSSDETNCCDGAVEKCI